MTFAQICEIYQRGQDLDLPPEFDFTTAIATGIVSHEINQVLFRWLFAKGFRIIKRSFDNAQHEQTFVIQHQRPSEHLANVIRRFGDDEAGLVSLTSHWPLSDVIWREAYAQVRRQRMRSLNLDVSLTSYRENQRVWLESGMPIEKWAMTPIPMRTAKPARSLASGLHERRRHIQTTPPPRETGA